MKRQEAIALLKELVATFNSIKLKEYIVLKNEQKTGFWHLQVKWIPYKQEEQELQEIAKKHNLSLTFENNKTTLKRAYVPTLKLDLQFLQWYSSILK